MNDNNIHVHQYAIVKMRMNLDDSIDCDQLRVE